MPANKIEVVTQGDSNIIIPDIPATDHDTIGKYELTGVHIYAEFNERLYLCYKFGKNVDPMKNLTFNMPVPIEYKEYFDIIMSRLNEVIFYNKEGAN